MPALLLCISQPGKAAHPNARSHWAAKAKAVARIREETALGAARLMEWYCPNWELAWLRLYYGFQRRGRRDPDNLISWAKGVVDGLVDSGMLMDDDQVTWMPPQVITPAPRCLLLHISSHKIADKPIPEEQVLRSMQTWHQLEFANPNRRVRL